MKSTFFPGLPQGQEKSGNWTKFKKFVCLNIQSFLKFQSFQTKKKNSLKSE